MEAAWWSPRALGSGIPRVCLSRQPEGGEQALESRRPGCHVILGPAFGHAHQGLRGRGDARATMQSVWSWTPRALLGLLSQAPRWCHLGMVQPGACSGNGGVSTASSGLAGTDVALTAVAGVDVVTGDWAVG